MMMNKVALASLITACWAFQAYADVALPDAASILDRYVQVTHASAPEGKPAIFTIDFSVSRGGGSIYYATVYRDLNGGLHMVVDDEAHPAEAGVSGGHVWRFSKQDGARILSGKAADRLIAETNSWSGGSLAGFAAGWGGSFPFSDWRTAFRSSRTVGRGAVHGVPCYEVVLTRTDGSTIHCWFETRSGLLARETAGEFDESGNEQAYDADVTDYQTTLGFTHPSEIRIKSGTATAVVKINSIMFGVGADLSTVQVPRDVAQAITQANTPAGLPNALELAERFFDLARGDRPRDSVQTEVVTGTVSLPEDNIKIPLTQYVDGAKSYMSFEVPTMGKFEFGSDGRTGWQRSVVMGPQIVPRSQISAITGFGSIEQLGWTGEDLNLRTVSKQDIDGVPCYVVEEASPDGTSPLKLYFDTKTDYLVQAEMREKPGSDRGVNMRMSDYRFDDGHLIAHRIETALQGKAIVVDITETKWNVPIPETKFALPQDIVDLLAQQRQEQAKQPDADKPTLQHRGSAH